MGILDFFRRKSSGDSVHPFREAAQAELEESLGIGVGSATKAATVYSCAQILSEDVAKLPIKLHRKIDDVRQEITSGHLYERITQAPNLNHTPIEFYSMLMWDLVMRGEAFAFISRTAEQESRVLEMLPINCESVSIYERAKHNFEYVIGGVPIPRKNILHIRDKVDRNGRGKSRISATADAIGLELTSERLFARLFRNGLRMTPVLQHPESLSEAARERLKKQLKDAISGDRMFDPLVLEEGLKWEPSQMTAKDAQLLEAREFQRGVVTAIFRVPPHKLGILSGAKFSNMETQEQIYWNDTVSGWTTKIEQAIRRDVFTDKERAEGYYVRFNFGAMVKADMKTRFDAYNIGRRAGILSADDCRAKEDLPPRPDGLGGVFHESGDLYPSGKDRN